MRRDATDDLVSRHDRQFRIAATRRRRHADRCGKRRRPRSRSESRPVAGCGISPLPHDQRRSRAIQHHCAHHRHECVLRSPRHGRSLRFQLARKNSTSRPTMRTEEPRPVRLQDYRPPDWLIETVDLDVSLDPTATTVRAKLKLKPNSAGTPAPLVLDGEELKLRLAHARRQAAAGGNFRRHAGPADHRAAAEPAVRPRDRDRRRSRRPTPSSWAFTAPATPIARNARPRVFAASPISSTGRT